VGKAIRRPRRWQIVLGDCVKVLAEMDANSIDSIVTDPPYGLKFMGKGWDDMGHGSEQQAWHYRWAIEALRVLKPGGHLLAFGGTRTYHRLVSALEDAGFEIRDQVQWLYGTGFPKSHNVSKAINKAAGAEREVIGMRIHPTLVNPSEVKSRAYHVETLHSNTEAEFWPITAPSTSEATQWEGWGTALKPAHEPIVVARKPFKGTVAANVLEHGTGGINIDATRVVTKDNLDGGAYAKEGNARHDQADNWRYKRDGSAGDYKQPEGRWPANVILDEEAGAMLDEQTGTLISGKSDGFRGTHTAEIYGEYTENIIKPENIYADSGGASRFFYCAKASKSEREAGLSPPKNKKRANTHPTVKPIALIAYLVRMVTPLGGIVLDPFVGSGSTGIAALNEGFRFVGVEIDSEYSELAKSRIRHGLIQAAKERKESR